MKKLSQYIYQILGRRNLRLVLVVSFVLVSFIPLLVSQLVSSQRVRATMQNNMDQMAQTGVVQTQQNLELSLDSYEDILYQLYTNDELVTHVQNIISGQEVALNTNQLNRILRAMLYAKDDIEAITIITSTGEVVFYDKMRTLFIKNSWIDSYTLSAGEILDTGMSDFDTKLLPSAFVDDTGINEFYLFHMVHRIIDYTDVNREIGVVVLSLNENILHTICGQDDPHSFNFIIDTDGRLISYPNKAKIGASLSGYADGDPAARQASFRRALADDGYMAEQTTVYVSDSWRGWRVASVIDQSAAYADIARQERASLLVGVAIIAVTALFIFVITSLFSRSIHQFETVMERARAGDLNAYADEKGAFSKEMATIASTYNSMMEQIKGLLSEVKSATIRQKDAEIKALEAQINPHFLYNILDSINWMAIDEGQIEVSRMITALARILRYSIDNSNGVVPLREEMAWLEKYLYLQRMRFKDSFTCSIEVEEGLLDHPVHKLLLQPFIENAILHGFKEGAAGSHLHIGVAATDGITFVIEDNGRGMDEDTLRRAQSQSGEAGDHIGMANAIGRIEMYYGERATVAIESEPGRGTRVVVSITDAKGGEPLDGGHRGG